MARKRKKRKKRSLVGRLRGAVGAYVRLITKGPGKVFTAPAASRWIVWLAMAALPVATVASLVSLVLNPTAVSFLVLAFCLLVLVAGAVALVVVRDKLRHRGTRKPASTGAVIRPREWERGAPAVAVTPDPGQPLVSIIVCVKNEQRWLGDALTSVLYQDLESWECLVIDDGSSDATLDVVMGFAGRDPRIKVLSTSTSQGLAAARNEGLRAARGLYVSFLDGDDFLMPGSLRVRMAAVVDDPFQIGTYADWRSVDESAAPGQLSLRRGRPRRPYLDYVSVGFEAPFVVHAPVIRRDLALAAGGFDPSLRSGEDIDFWARLLRGGGYLTYVPKVSVAYRIHHGSMMLGSADKHIETVRDLADWKSEAWSPWAGAPDPVMAPMTEIVRDVSLARRYFYNAALAIADGDPDGARAALVPALRRIDRSVRRSKSVSAEIMSQTSAALKRRAFPDTPSTEHVSRIAQSIRDWLAGLDTAPSPEAELQSHLPSQLLEVARVDRLTTAPLLSLAGRQVFLVGADSRYHAYESGPLLQELRARGIDAVPFLVSAGYVDRKILIDWGRFTDVVYEGSVEDFAALDLIGGFVLNDFSPNAEVLKQRLAECGAPLFAKVEGVQDFEDVDTGRQRHPYRRADVVFAQGVNDVEALAERGDVVMVGSSRLEQIWNGPAVPADLSTGLVNFNFTYRVMTEHQKPWLSSVVDAFERAGVPYRISAHWAQKDIPRDPRVSTHIAPEPFRFVVQKSGLLVTRFSTVAFEAMAHGVPVIYHNPHGERVPTFSRPEGAFLVTDSAESLARAIPEALSMRGRYREISEPFFRRQVDVDPQRPSHVRAADVIVDRLAAGRS